MFIESLEVRRLLASTLTTIATSRELRLQPIGSRLYYTSEDAFDQFSLRVNNGAATQTRLANALTDFPGDFGVWDGKLYYEAPAFFGTNGQVRVSDGTVDGSRPVAAQHVIGEDFNPRQVATIGANHFTLTTDPLDPHYARLLRFGDTIASAQVLGRFEMKYADDPIEGIGGVTNVGGRLWFLTGDVYDQLEDVPATLWTSDGTAAGTHAVREFKSFNFSSTNFAQWESYRHPANGGAVEGQTFYFAADDGTSGFELWRSDGTAQGTSQVADLIPGRAGSEPSGLGYINGRFIFLTDPLDNDAVAGIYSTDGTTAGTIKISDTRGFGPSLEDDASEALVIGNRLYFGARGGNELWTTDGSIRHTKRIYSGDRLNHFVEFRGRLYFEGRDANFVSQIFSSDGTTAGTTKAVKIPGHRSDTNFVGSLTVIGRSLYFTTDDIGTFTETLYRLSDDRISIAGVAFDDTDADGFRDSGERANAGVAIFLDENHNGSFDDGELSTTTDARGRWAFDDIAPGDYTPTQLLSGDAWDTSDKSQTALHLVAGDHVVVDLGSTAGNVLIGHVQEDLTVDRRLPYSDPGVSDISVLLDGNDNGKRDADEQVVTTDDAGRYVLRNLDAKSHVVRLLPSNDWLPTTATRITATANKSNTSFARAFGVGLPPVVTGAVHDTSTQQRIRTPVKLFLDRDDDGRLDSNEVVTTTDKKGRFRFSGPSMSPGMQSIRVVPGEAWEIDPNVFPSNVVDLAYGSRADSRTIAVRPAT